MKRHHIDPTLIRACANRIPLTHFLATAKNLNAATVQRMYVLEARNRNRPRILEQLMARYKKECETELKAKVAK